MSEQRGTPPQDFSDDVCRSARCSGDGRLEECAAGFWRASTAEEHMQNLRAALAAYRLYQPAVQPEERGRKP